MSILVFKFLVNDDRYAAAKGYVVEAASRERARELAHRILEESPHHLGVEVWEGEALLLTIAQPAGAPITGRPEAA